MSRSHARPERRVCVVGLGYIGLPTAAVLASRGFDVVGVDAQLRVVETIEGGKAHIVEPDLDMLVQAAVSSGRLTVRHAEAEVPEADVLIFCLPTPVGQDERPDLSTLERAVDRMMDAVAEDALVIVESTVPPGTTERLASLIRAARGPGVRVAHAPERVLPGRIIREVTGNDRVVGGVDEESTDAAAAFYETFVTGDVLRAEARLAESVKLIENAFRDVNIAFANELSVVADVLQIDVWRAIALANRHPRVEILRPGPGVGGHCIAVDPYFLIDAAGPANTPVMRTARAVNQAKPGRVRAKIEAAAQRFREPRIAILGLAYKPNVDDLRESPALQIARELIESGVGDVVAVEPNCAAVEGVTIVSLEQALAQADVIGILVGHAPFRKLSAQDFNNAVVIDACGLLA